MNWPQRLAAGPPRRKVLIGTLALLALVGLILLGEILAAARAERLARRQLRAEAEAREAKRGRADGRLLSALAHAIAALRLRSDPQAADLAWDIRSRTPQLLWTSPRPPGSGSAVPPVDEQALLRHIHGADDATDEPYDGPGQPGAILALAFSPDGRRVASASRDETAGLWDAATGKLLARLEAHTAPVLAVAFSPDGRSLASGSEDRTVRLWDVSAARELGRSQEGRPVAGETEWRDAWLDRETDGPTGLPRRVARLLDRWERDLGMRINLDTGELERIPTPPPAYADDPKIAPLCK